MKLTIKEVEKLIELEKKATRAPWKVIENEDDGGVLIGMDSYLKNPHNHYTNHLIEYADCVWPEDESYSELKSNADLISEMRRLVKAMAAQILKDQEALNKMFCAMKKYQMDVEEDPPYEHREMMRFAESTLLPKE